MRPTPVVAAYSTKFHGSGMEEGPDAVLIELLEEHAPPHVLRPEVPEGEPLKVLPGLLGQLADAVAGAPTMPLALLGECTLTPGVVAGLQRRHEDLGVVWIDAHGDLNTPDTTLSGFLGGMPFAVLLGWCLPELRPGEPVREEHAALIGARDLDPGEADAIERSQLVTSDTVSEALNALPLRGPLYVHIDGDVLDPSAAPGVDFPAPGGWDVERLRRECEALAGTARVVGVSVCCGNPRRDPEGVGARAYADAIEPFLV